MITSIPKVLFVACFTVVVTAIMMLVAPLTPGATFDALARFYSRTILRVCGVKIVVRGREHVDFSQHYIYVANHASLFDIPAVVAGIPDGIRIVYKRELNLIPFLGWAMKLTNRHIGIDRARGLAAMRRLEEAIKRVITGASLLLFAEGTRSPDGQLQTFKRGAFNLAVRTGIRVVPLTIVGSSSVLRKKSFRIVPGTITLILDKPIEPKSAGGKAAELQLLEETRSVIKRHYIEKQ